MQGCIEADADLNPESVLVRINAKSVVAISSGLSPGPVLFF